MADQIPIVNSNSQLTVFAGEFLYVGVGIEVTYTGGGTVIDAHFGSSTIHNDGTIASLSGMALGAGGVLVNGAGGHIVAQSLGITTSPGGVSLLTIDNRGTIFSQDIGITERVGNTLIVNSGTVESGYGNFLGVNAAIEIRGPAATMTLLNSGRIITDLATGYSVLSDALSTSADSITNTGTMIGNVSLSGGGDVLNTAGGTIAGTIDMGAGADTFIGSAFADTVSGGSENDSLTGNGGNDALGGGAGLDTLIGGLGNDFLDGGSQNDVLKGGSGRDRLTGGADKDTFVFDSPLSRTTNVDLIVDFNHADDTIQLSHSIFHALAPTAALKPTFFFQGTHAHDADDRIIYNKATGALYYDSDGTGAHAQVQFATILNHSTTTVQANDFAVV